MTKNHRAHPTMSAKVNYKENESLLQSVYEISEKTECMCAWRISTSLKFYQLFHSFAEGINPYMIYHMTKPLT